MKIFVASPVQLTHCGICLFFMVHAERSIFSHVTASVQKNCHSANSVLLLVLTTVKWQSLRSITWILSCPESRDSFEFRLKHNQLKGLNYYGDVSHCWIMPSNSHSFFFPFTTTVILWNQTVILDSNHFQYAMWVTTPQWTSHQLLRACNTV